MLEQKIEQLKDEIRTLKRLAVAFSGGTDSAFLLKVCEDTLEKNNVLAITADFEGFLQHDLKESQRFTKELGVRHKIVKLTVLDIPDIANNPPNRCYYCKKEILSAVISAANDEGYDNIAEGSNISDIGDFRPGMKAVEEMGIKSPLKSAGLTKEEVREASRKLELYTWDKPSAACLFSRFPYGEKITLEKVKRVSDAEEILSAEGFSQFRVRSHGNLARIEVLPGEIDKFLERGFRDKITCKFRQIGFKYITIDLDGYRIGSMNDELKEGDKLFWKKN